MPAATLDVAPQSQTSSASLFVPALRRTLGEPTSLMAESETALAQEVSLEQKNFGEPLIIATEAPPLEQVQGSEFGVFGTSGGVHWTPASRLEVDIAPDVRPYLTGPMDRLFRILLAIARTKANISRLAITKIHTYMFKDPEENVRRFVLKVSIKANPAQAMAYWDAVGRGVDTWRDGLPEHLKQMLISRWSFQVEWSSDGPTQV